MRKGRLSGRALEQVKYQLYRSRQEGMGFSELARLYGCSRQNVSKHIRNYEAGLVRKAGIESFAESHFKRLVKFSVDLVEAVEIGGFEYWVVKDLVTELRDWSLKEKWKLAKLTETKIGANTEGNEL